MPLAAIGLVLLDTLVLSRAAVVLRSGHSPAPHEAALLLSVLIGLQLLLLGVIGRLQASVHRYRSLKQAFEQELDLSRQLLESSDVGVALLNENAQFAYVNRAFSDLLTRPAGELLGRTLHDALPDATLPDELSGADGIHWPLTVPRTGDGPMQVVVKGTPRWYGGRVVGTILSVTREDTSPEGRAPDSARPAPRPDVPGTRRGPDLSTECPA